MLRSKKPPVAREFSEDVTFELHFERNYDLTPANFFCGEDWGGTRRAYWLRLDCDAIRQCTRVLDDASTALTWAVHVTSLISKKKCRDGT